jgi:hypothetical protein
VQHSLEHAETFFYLTVDGLGSVAASEPGTSGDTAVRRRTKRRATLYCGTIEVAFRVARREIAAALGDSGLLGRCQKRSDFLENAPSDL